MSYRIGNIQQDYSAVDFASLQEDLALAEVENMDDVTFAAAKYKATGVRPTVVAAVNAEKFGLKKAFWDVYQPIEGPAAGMWRLEKDASTGEDLIVRKDSALQGEVK